MLSSDPRCAGLALFPRCVALVDESGPVHSQGLAPLKSCQASLRGLQAFTHPLLTHVTISCCAVAGCCTEVFF